MADYTELHIAVIGAGMLPRLNEAPRDTRVGG